MGQRTGSGRPSNPGTCGNPYANTRRQSYNRLTDGRTDTHNEAYVEVGVIRRGPKIGLWVLYPTALSRETCVQLEYYVCGTSFLLH